MYSASLLSFRLFQTFSLVFEQKISLVSSPLPSSLRSGVFHCTWTVRRHVYFRDTLLYRIVALQLSPTLPRTNEFTNSRSCSITYAEIHLFPLTLRYDNSFRDSRMTSRTSNLGSREICWTDGQEAPGPCGVLYDIRFNVARMSARRGS